MAVPFSKQRRSLLASDALVQVPFIKVKIGDYSFGVYNKSTKLKRDSKGFYLSRESQYPNLVQRLSIVKINGQVNQYTLTLTYPVGISDDPNYFEKVISSVSESRSIEFTYGDSNRPNYIYKEEKAIITDITNSFNFGSGGQLTSAITYTIKATSVSNLSNGVPVNFIAPSYAVKPSSIIKSMFTSENRYHLQELFPGMNAENAKTLIAGGDKAVKLTSKPNTTPLDLINYLVSCMTPAGSGKGTNIDRDIYVLTLYDETTYDEVMSDNVSAINGPYFRVKKISYMTEQADAFEIDIGYPTNTLVLDFKVNNNQSYSLFYNYQKKLNSEAYARRLVNGKWEEEFSPMISSKNDNFTTRQEDINWWTQVTQFPITASITLQGLLRPATLMQYVRLNVIFPGGHKHITSGLYLVTQQTDDISSSGYRTTLGLTKISGDNDLQLI